MGSKDASVTVGYRYYWSMHMGIGRAIDSLVEIRVGDKSAWPLKTQEVIGYDAWGNKITQTVPAPDPVTENQTIQINAPDLFGGDSSEGGIVGPLDVMMGAPDQPVNSKMQALFGGLMPAFRGVCSFFFDGQVCALNPYPKAWKFRVRRALKGWDGDPWYPEKAVIVLCGDIHAMNPAHILYECATNIDWGDGRPRAALDEESFISAANTLYKECFGLCMKWSRSNTDLADFVKSVIDHIGAALYVSRQTGLLTLKLIRSDYTLDQLTTFTPSSGLVAISDDDASSSDTNYNEVIVQWHDPITDQDASVRVQLLSAISGGVTSNSVSYAGLPTADLAMRVAQRDLRATGTPLRRLKVTLDRRGWKIHPGMVFRVEDLQAGISGITLRAGKIEDDTNGDSKIVVTAVEDIFGLPDTAYVAPQESTHTPPNREPVPIDTDSIETFEVPYRELVRTLTKADLANVEPDSGTPALLAERPMPLALSYALYTAATGEAFVERNSGDFTPYGILSQELPLDPNQRVVYCSALEDAQSMQPGTFAMIDTECVKIVSIDTTASTVTVDRGVMDTIPARHTAGATLYFAEDFYGTDKREYADGETAHMKPCTRTSAATIDVSLVNEVTQAIIARHTKPYPPGNLTLNSNGFYQANLSATGDMVFAWAHRDRITQADKLIGHLETDIGPETGTTYNLRIYDSTDTIVKNLTGITSNTVTVAESDIAGGGATMRAELESERDGIVSFQKYSFTFRHFLSSEGGWGFDYGNNWGG